MHSAHPVVHLQLSCRSQADGPPLFGSLCCIDGKRVFGLIQYRHQDRHFINKHMKILDGGGAEKFQIKGKVGIELI